MWKGEVYSGAPLVWSRCRTDRFSHQQWRTVPDSSPGGTGRGIVLMHDPQASHAGATTAREGATTAREGATTAREGATTARDGATTARDGATTARDGASGSPREGLDTEGALCAAAPMPMHLLQMSLQPSG